MVTKTTWPLIAARFGAALRGAGVPVGPGAVRAVRGRGHGGPAGDPDQLYLCALATLVSSQAQVEPLRRVFGEVFGGTGEPVRTAPPGGPELPRPGRSSPDDLLAEAARAARQHALQPDGQRGADSEAAGRPGGPGRYRRVPVADGQAAGDEDRAPRSRRWPAGRNGWPAPTSPS